MNPHTESVSPFEPVLRLSALKKGCSDVLTTDVPVFYNDPFNRISHLREIGTDQRLTEYRPIVGDSK